jgi:5-methylcytosine-specific restriction endonuclease McrA
MHRPAGYRPAPNRRKEIEEPFYQSPEWRRTRAYVLKRDGYQCTEPQCETPNRGKGGRLIAGHIVDRRKGGSDHHSNVRTFCPTCDNRWHAEKGRGSSGL